MASVSTYLNFDGKTEEAFNFYKKVFGTDFEGEISRMGEVPPQEGMPELTEAEKKLVMHVSLPILAGHKLMGTDVLKSMGHTLEVGNNFTINLEPDSKEEADRLFKELSEGGKVGNAMQDMFWGDYYGDFTDKFGVRWMINFHKR